MTSISKERRGLTKAPEDLFWAALLFLWQVNMRCFQQTTTTAISVMVCEGHARKILFKAFFQIPPNNLALEFIGLL
jgi:hypothetical protein